MREAKIGRYILSGRRCRGQAAVPLDAQCSWLSIPAGGVSGSHQLPEQYVVSLDEHTADVACEFREHLLVEFCDLC